MSNSEPLLGIVPRGTFTTPFTVLIGIWLFYLLSLAVNRLYLSPIAKFPGPKAAALSRWYEFYYEVILKGQYSSRIDEMHRQYGPIVRVAPDEIHIKDSQFFDDLYVKTGKPNKHEWAAGRFGNHGSIITTSEHALHRRRRAALNPFFSKKSILEFQPIIRQKVELLSKRISEYKDKGTPVVLSEAFPAFAGDVITEYAFGICYNHLDSPDFSDSFHAAFMAVGEFGHVAVQFPWFHPLLNALPHSLVRSMQPALGTLLQLRVDLKDMLQRLTEGGELKEGKSSSHRTIFHDMLQSSLPPEDKGNRRMADEAQTVIGGGIETTAFALSVGFFHILNQPDVYKRLYRELVDAIPDPNTSPDLTDVEQLPYLRACITESVRLSYGVSARNPRVLNQPLQYKQWTIPPQTAIGMTIVDVHHDESIFPDSHSYIPERWLGNPKAPDGSSLDHYFLSFGKGTRGCLGINLAYAEMFLVLATLLRRFRFELFETDESDVRLKHDFFLPSPKLDSKGVRAHVVEIYN